MGDNLIRDVQFIDWLGEQRPFYGHKIISVPSTPTPTPTATNTPTPSVTPTYTPTKSVTPTKTPTNTPTPTITPSTTKYVAECDCFYLSKTGANPYSGTYCRSIDTPPNGIIWDIDNPDEMICGDNWALFRKITDNQYWVMARKREGAPAFQDWLAFRDTSGFAGECGYTTLAGVGSSPISEGYQTRGGWRIPLAGSGITYNNC